MYDSVTRYARDTAGEIHWFQGSRLGDGVLFHWSGQTNGMTKRGVYQTLYSDQVKAAIEVLGP